MIPTRLNQKFHHGTVSGFNRTTGSLVIFSNTAYYSDSTNAAQFLQHYNESTREFPEGYKWPTEIDFQHLLGAFVKDNTVVDGEIYELELAIPTLPDSFKSYVQQLLGNRSSYSTWVVFDKHFKYRSCHSFIEVIISEGFGEFLCEFDHYTSRVSRDGYLVPVFCINGANVDQVDCGVYSDTNE